MEDEKIESEVIEENENENVSENENENDEKKSEEVVEENENQDGSKDDSTEEQKQLTDKERNAYYANLRRQNEQKNGNVTQQNKSTNSDYFKGIITATNGINPYTGKSITDDEDLKEFELMVKLSKEGKDPVKDYLEAVKEEKREEQRKILEANKEKEKQNEELDEFVKTYGVDTLRQLAKDQEFCKFADNFNKTATISNIYKIYLDVNDRADKKAKSIAEEKEARRKSGSGNQNKGNSIVEKIDFINMTSEQFKEYQNKKGYR
ncbi:MAG: hypothetical protein ACI4WW_02630 [Candidatus Coprovivens sp.]